MPVIEVERSGIASGQGMVTCGWDGSGVAVGCGVAVGAGVGVGRGVAVGIGVAVGWGVGRSVGKGVAVGCGVEVADGVAVGVGLGVAVGASVGVGRGAAVGAGVSAGAGEGVGRAADADFASVVWRIPAAVVASMLAVGVGVGAWVDGIVAGGSVASDAHAKTANSRGTPDMVARSLFSMGGMVARSNRRNDYRVLERSDGLDGPFRWGLPVLS